MSSISTISTIYQPTPITSGQSTNSSQSSTLSLSLNPFVISYDYHFEKAQLQTILERLNLQVMTREQIMTHLLQVMEYVEYHFAHLPGADKKRLTFDTLFFLGELSGFKPIEFDTLLLSSTIDTISQLGKTGTIVNKMQKQTDQSTQTDTNNSNEKKTCLGCF